MISDAGVGAANGLIGWVCRGAGSGWVGSNEICIRLGRMCGYMDVFEEGTGLGGISAGYDDILDRFNKNNVQEVSNGSIDRSAKSSFACDLLLNNRHRKDPALPIAYP